jgi:diguanylate cyclase (GGDEF)-like protein
MMPRLIPKLVKNTSLTAKIMIPVIFLGILSILIGSKIVGTVLEEQISRTEKKEVENFGNKIYFTIKADFKTLFFDFGNDPEHFRDADSAAQKETINDLKQVLAGGDDIVYLTTPKGRYMLSGHTPPEASPLRQLSALPYQAALLTETDDYFVYTRRFLPWQWQIVVLREKSLFTQIVRQNLQLTSFNITLLVLAVLLLLAYILKVTINDPFKRIFEHLDCIRRGEYATLSLPVSREIDRLVQHLNLMSRSIDLRERDLIAEKNKSRSILDSQRAIVLVTNGEHIVDVNHYFFEFFDDFSGPEILKTGEVCIANFFMPADEPGFLHRFEGGNWLEGLFAAKEPQKVKLLKNDTLHIFNITANRIASEHEDLYVVTLNDITELERYKQEIESKKEALILQLHTDALTDLPNRLKLIEDIARNDAASLILINIDAFKEINDFYGNPFGDKVLIEFGQRIREHSYREGYTLYKLAADEYALYKPGTVIRAKCTDYLHHLSQTLNSQHYDIDGNEVVFSTTIGAGINISRASLLIHTDVALKTAKKNKKELLVYDESLETLQEFALHLEWVNRLKQAIDTDRVIPYFQAIRDNSTGKIGKYEALIRMIGSDGAPIAPYLFLDIARKSHQYLALTEIMIDKTFRRFKGTPYQFSVNLSATDILDPEIHDLVLRKIEHYDVGNQLVIELLETEGIENYDKIDAFIRNIRQYGCKIAIDDFGSGFSNFEHVISLNVDFLKIDASLIRNITTDTNALVIVETIANFSRKLGILTIAEFVENAEIEAKVKELGIHYSQGYHIARPQPELLEQMPSATPPLP